MKIILLLLFFAFLLPVQVEAATLFEHRDRTYLSRGVTYDRLRQVTSAGFLDVHILTAPLNDPYITISPVESRRELGLRETALTMLSDAGAIAGTNADFFGMSGTHNVAFGPVIANGQLMSIAQAYNQGSNEFASFFLDENNFPMLSYIRPRIWFTIDGIELMRINSINKVGTLEYPIIITRSGMTNTSQLSARFEGLHKAVIQDGIVTNVASHPVDVPVNGFVVVMNEHTFLSHHPHFWIGRYAHYEVFTNLGRDLSQIQTAVGGGGLILQHGHIVHDTGTVIAGRHPRTALGITSDWSSMVLMVVDGRGHSIGATHEEMAALLLRHNVTNAMHLDGGGSSTMVAPARGRGTALEVVNRVSDGSQRRIVNALGIFDNSIPGEAVQLVLLPYNRYVARGSELNLGVYGLDLYRHRIGINPEGVQFSAYRIDAGGNLHPAGGTWQGSTYIPDGPGAIYIRARYGELTVSKTYLVQDIVALQFENAPILTTVDMAIPLTVSGVTATAETVRFEQERNYVQFTVTPPELGMVLDGVFIPAQGGTGHITAIMGSIYARLFVAVNTPDNEIDPDHFAAQAQATAGITFVDPIRTAMTAVIPGNAFDFNVFIPGYGNLAYASRPEGPAAILQISAANGGIFATDRSQWGRFISDISALNPSFVIIRMDVNPLHRLSRDEMDLFHLALRSQHDLGRTVFVVSNVGSTPSFSLRDGIRYIDVGNAGNDSTMQFRVIDGQIWYDF